MTVLEALRNRRSVRKYTGEAIPDALFDRVLEAGLLSASGRKRRPWEFVVVRNKEKLAYLAECRTAGAGMLAGADAAIVVLGQDEVADTWIEDCSIVMANMHLVADSLGLGSCWIQGRMREAADGRTTEAYVFDALKVPEGYRLEAVLSLGMPAEHAAPTTDDEIFWEKVHREGF